MAVQCLGLEARVAIYLSFSVKSSRKCWADIKRDGELTSRLMARTGIFLYVNPNAEVRTGRGIIDCTITKAIVGDVSPGTQIIPPLSWLEDFVIFKASHAR